MKLPRLVVPLVIVLTLAGCGGGGGGGGNSTDFVPDPWLVDDLDTGAAVVTGAFMGVDMIGFTCDVSMSVSAEGAAGVRPTASATAVLGNSSIDYQEEHLVSTALGTVALPADVPPTLEVSTDHGYWDIGDGGQNTPWTPSVTLSLTEVPVPVDGCTAADMLAQDLIDVGSSAPEIVEAFTKVGLKDVSKECPDEWFTWVPPNLSCEEFAARAG